MTITAPLHHPARSITSRTASADRSPGLWKHPQDRAGDFTDLSYWIELAKILEKGKFHGLFLADHLGIYDVYKGPGNKDPALLSGAQFPIGDPL